MRTLTFFRLSPSQQTAFDRARTTRALQNHGPLAFGQEVPVHDHDEPAVYVVDGLAYFKDDQGTCRAIGRDATANAVVVPAGQAHGWQGLFGGTRIEHVIGAREVENLLAVA